MYVFENDRCDALYAALECNREIHGKSYRFAKKCVRYADSSRRLMR